MNEFELLIDLHRYNQRQGPGGVGETEKAIGLTGLENEENLNMADIGCGSGGQTLTLAKKLDGHITAVDLFPEFLEELKVRSGKEGLDHRISTLTASMDDLPFGEEEFDLIWSEGAIYLMGFEKGITKWIQHLKPGGILAVSDISWITEKRPDALEKFWAEECPEIDTVDAKLKVLETQGYAPLGHFILPEDCWIENYYRPLQESHDTFLERQGHSNEARELVKLDTHEYEMYLQYKEHYSYGFYVAKKL